MIYVLAFGQQNVRCRDSMLQNGNFGHKFTISQGHLDILHQI